MSSFSRLKRAAAGPVRTPLWDATAPSGPRLPWLAREVETDVAIVGAGIAGLSTALHLAEAGVETVVVEAAQPGGGATGQSGGLVAPDFIRHSPASISEQLGHDAGERLTRFVGGSARQCFELVERLGIECDHRQDGFWSPSHTAALSAQQAVYAAEWQARGFDVRFVDREETQTALGSPLYTGALYFPGGGRLNPLAYVRGLAVAAERAGAAIFTDSAVTGIERSRDGYRLKTAGGSVKARRLVLAANGGNAWLHKALRGTVLPLHVVEFATGALSPAQKAAVLPEGGSFTDKAPYVFTARYDGAGRLISAFPVSFLVRSERRFLREASHRLAQHFPGIGDLCIDYLWEGTAWINPSLLPQIYRLGDNAYAIQACNGRGIATNSALGRELAAALAAGSFTDLSVQPQQPTPIRFHRLASLMPKALMTVAFLFSPARRGVLDDEANAE